MSDPIAVVSSYFKLIQDLDNDASAFAAVLHPEVEQTEYPNLLSRNLVRRSYEEILSTLRNGREVLVDSRFEMDRLHSCTDGSVVAEGHWRAQAIIDLGPVVRGQLLVAQLCMVFEFKDGKIYRQRSFHNFETV
ncbi:nuclear transport factor 2 family protein [Hymenobacter sp. BT491]|uniref:nuclear transport factor 2 family protein n=1 Tax=Hymenobacter sp. BT491 TaxID=2766779 RepID=UPI0016538B80|nr:nuclear transport factor 2 family protein [Hymenobacter sp. BT491]MBC6991912.1 nuclear transport factor 2 family protein [Hymenobacter sp. BT491]